LRVRDSWTRGFGDSMTYDVKFHLLILA
jgi:hypothetical protein